MKSRLRRKVVSLYVFPMGILAKIAMKRGYTPQSLTSDVYKEWKNAKKRGKEDFGIELDLNSLCTDIDVLNIANTVNAFGTRFAKSIKMQEAEAKRFYEAKLNDLKAQQMALTDEIDKMEQAV